MKSIITRQERQFELQKSCPICHGIIQSKKQFCNNCGADLEVYRPEIHEGVGELLNCPKCHELIDKDSVSCKFCDAKLKICGICKEFIEEKKPAVCPFCNSEFHVVEYFEWIEWEKKCPNCKREIKDVNVGLKNIDSEFKEKFQKISIEYNKFLVKNKKIFIFISLIIIGFAVFAIIWKFFLVKPELSEDQISYILELLIQNKNP